MADSATKYVMGKNGQRRMKDVELCLPICAGTVSFWQGKKVRNELRNGPGQGDPPHGPEEGGGDRGASASASDGLAIAEPEINRPSC